MNVRMRRTWILAALFLLSAIPVDGVSLGERVPLSGSDPGSIVVDPAAVVTPADASARTVLSDGHQSTQTAHRGTAANWSAEGDQESAWFGVVASAGDVNGDGYADVIVGCPRYDNGEDDEGQVYVYHGSAAGLAGVPDWTMDCDQASGFFGWSVASAGDVNGDGYSDVIVGAQNYDNGEENEGAVFVYHGSATGLASSPAWTAESDQAGAGFGRSVATAGDVNGDGYSDVIVGAWHYDNGEADEGRAYVYHGSPGGLVTMPAWSAEGDDIGACFGICVGTAGDVNGDGYSDVIVGAPFYGFWDRGRVYVFHGSASGLATTSNWRRTGDQDDCNLGASVATAGDVNDDGYSDVVLGADFYSNGEYREGRVYAYHGSATGLPLTPAWTVESNQAESGFGYPVASAGDVNDDGYSDVIVGAWSYDNDQTDEGRAFVYFGSASGLETAFGWSAEGDQQGSEFGVLVATAGDVNADGADDVIVGAPAHDNGEVDEGRAYVYHGWTSQVDAPVAVTPVTAGFELLAAGPNPSKDHCEVLLSLHRATRVRAEVLDVSGSRVAALVHDRRHDPGLHVLHWDGRASSGSEAAPGVYFFRVRSEDDGTKVRKAVLMR